MIIAVVRLLVIGWLPGAVIFRLPVLDRDRRAALPAEERLFWQIVISLGVSLSIVLALAAVHRYSFTRLLVADVLVAGTLTAFSRFRLRMYGRRPTATALIALALVGLGYWRFFPAAEYVIGGKDPGVYINEGIQIAQRGTLVYNDPTISSVPPASRDLFFPSHQRTDYYSVRFMGFFIRDPDSGAVVGQFPHLFPASIAIGYGIDGLTGARVTVGFWAILGLLAVYFAAARIAGPVAAFAASALLALHVIEVWFGRYPNAEVVMQSLLFAAVLASARAHADDDPFFAPLAGFLLGLLIFLRFDALVGIAGVLTAVFLVVLAGRRVPRSFIVALSATALVALPYFAGPLFAYVDRPYVFLTNLFWWQYVALIAATLALARLLLASRRSQTFARKIAMLAPAALSLAMVAGAVYTLLLRHPGGKLAAHDAYALRTFTNYYATLPALIAALIGYVVLARRVFWRSPELFTTFALFCFVLFYKIHIVPEHFWMARRFVAVILPGMLIFACAAATWGLRRKGPGRLLSAAIGAMFIVLLGNHYMRAAAPVMTHVEYAGIIPQLEQLAGRIGDDDLLIVESRDAGSDAHVMALPLAYIYARHVLVLASARPDRSAFGPFLDWARARYRHVYFLGGGGTELLSRQWTANPVASQRFQVPEYESTVNAYPRLIRAKEFDFGLYELVSGANAPGTWFDLDVGIRDDLHVVRFHAKEQVNERTIRWTQRQSFVSVPDMPVASRELVLVMSSGGRPEAANPADVTVSLNERVLGTVRVADGFRPYSLAIPADIAEQASKSDEPARIRIVTPVWNPHLMLGSADDRELGVIVDRVQVR